MLFRSLVSIELPNSLQSIGESAFESCRDLTSIIIKGDGLDIGTKAFYQCTNLARLTISEGVIAIGEEAFYRCPLKWVSFPKSLKKIDDSAIEVLKPAEIYFSWEDLSGVDIQGLSTGKYSFGEDIVLYVPAGKKMLYKDYLAKYELKFFYSTIKDGAADTPNQFIDLGDNLYLASKEDDPEAIMLKVKITNQQKSQLLSSSGYYNAIRSIVKDVYVRFNDDFDFIFVIMGDDGSNNNLGFNGVNHPVSNNIQGIGRTNYAFNNEWGSAGKLKSVLYRPHGEDKGITVFYHEMAHQWANFIVKTYNYASREATSHWGITHFINSGNSSVLGGYPYLRKVGTVNGKTKYQGAIGPDINEDGSFTGGTSSGPSGFQNGEYSDIDLYLMGLKSAQELRENEFRLDVYSDISYDDTDVEKGYFYAGQVTSYTIDDIIRLNGPRIPDESLSQKHFKVLALLLSTDIESISAEWRFLLKMMEQKQRYAGYSWHTFYENTERRGTLEVQGLNKSLKPQFSSLYDGK